MKTLSKKFIYCECNKGNNRHPIRVVKVDDDLKQFIKEILDEIEKRQKVLGKHRPINWEGFWNELEELKQTIKNQEIN